MRIRILLLALSCVPACGDPVRKGDGYSGEPYVRFAARLTGPPMGYKEGDSLLPGLHHLVSGGWSADGTDQFRPLQSFPHDFMVEFSTPPRSDLSIFGVDAGQELTQVWYVEISVESPRSLPGPDAGAASLNHWLAYSEGAVQAFPLGPDGPALDLPGGYRLIRRTCTPGQLNHLAAAPGDEVIVVEPLQQNSAENEYRARCGAPLLPKENGG